MEHQHHRLEKTVICADGDGSLRSEEEKCQEASRSGRGSKAGGTAASVVGKRRGVRTTAQ